MEQDAYEGGNMSRMGDCVVVSVNHRLNVLGYFDLSPFGEKYRDSGNCGGNDIIAALKWVKDNICRLWRRSRECNTIRPERRRMQDYDTSADAWQRMACIIRGLL